MKHLLSLVAALAATALITLGLSSAARADLDVVTSIPDPSGAVSCYGQNSDGSAAAWTVGGEIRYTSDTSNPTTDYPNGWHNIKGIANPGANYVGCEWQVETSSNIKQGCPQITGVLYMYYTPHAGGTSWNSPGTYSILAPVASTGYTRATPFPFAEIDNANNVQYKVTSNQNMAELGREATTYL